MPSLLDQLTQITELIKSCLVPPLNFDIGTNQIESDLFLTFRQILNKNLELIFDFLSSTPEWNTTERQTSEYDQAVQLQTNLLILYCEQHSKYAPFQTDNRLLLNELEHQWRRCHHLMRGAVQVETFKYYKENIKADTWKRHLGASHSLAKYCELNIWDASLLSVNDCLFLLSAGTLLLEHFENVYKELGLDILSAVLHNTNREHILNTNIHEAIYNSCFHNLAMLKEKPINEVLWKCLYRYMHFNKSWKTPATEWQKSDDIFRKLLDRITLESNVAISLLLWQYLCRFASLPLFGNENENKLAQAFTDPKELEVIANDYFSHLTYKWVKKILYTLTLEQPSSYVRKEEALSRINTLHCCYLICIFSVNIKLFEKQLLEFFTKFIPILMNISRIQLGDIAVLRAVQSFLDTFTVHIQRDLQQIDSSECKEYFEKMNGAIVALAGHFNEFKEED